MPQIHPPNVQPPTILKFGDYLISHTEISNKYGTDQNFTNYMESTADVEMMNNFMTMLKYDLTLQDLCATLWKRNKKLRNLVLHYPTYFMNIFFHLLDTNPNLLLTFEEIQKKIAEVIVQKEVTKNKIELVHRIFILPQCLFDAMLKEGSFLIPYLNSMSPTSVKDLHNHLIPPIYAYHFEKLLNLITQQGVLFSLLDTITEDSHLIEYKPLLMKRLASLVTLTPNFKKLDPTKRKVPPQHSKIRRPLKRAYEKYKLFPTQSTEQIRLDKYIYENNSEAIIKEWQNNREWQSYTNNMALPKLETLFYILFDAHENAARLIYVNRIKIFAKTSCLQSKNLFLFFIERDKILLADDFAKANPFLLQATKKFTIEETQFILKNINRLSPVFFEDYFKVSNVRDYLAQLDAEQCCALLLKLLTEAKTSSEKNVTYLIHAINNIEALSLTAQGLQGIKGPYVEHYRRIISERAFQLANEQIRNGPNL